VALPGENSRGEVQLRMNLKQEALKAIRDQVGDRAISFNTTVTELSEQYETDMLDLVDTLETEFGVELSDEYLVDVETIGELCQVVARASKENGGDEDDD
jgi:acyl carrier protein